MFRQDRMGQNGRKFRIWKFRTMRAEKGNDLRSHDEPLETHRITNLGGLLRATRCDEIPNILNILSGQMSLIGPRPDAIEHAIIHSKSVPMYRDRLEVLPGITGLAQVRNGYADTMRLIERKVRWDLYYVENRSFSLDMKIIFQTIVIVLGGFKGSNGG